MVQPKGLGDVYRGDITIYHGGFPASQCGDCCGEFQHCRVLVDLLLGHAGAGNRQVLSAASAVDLVQSRDGVDDPLLYCVFVSGLAMRLVEPS